MKIVVLLSVIMCAWLHGEETPPTDAVQLKIQRDAKVAQIEETYIAELGKLKEKYTKAGDTEKSAAVTRMIEEAGNSSPETQAEPTDRQFAMLIGKWRRDYDMAIFEFKDGRTGTYGGNTPFTMHYDSAKKRVVLTSAKWVDSISFTLNGDILRGGHDNKIPYKLTRIR